MTTPTDMGSAADLKVGVQNGICVWSERKKNLYPSFPNVGDTSKQISRPKPSFQISLIWQVSTRVREVEIQSLVQY